MKNKNIWKKDTSKTNVQQGKKKGGCCGEKGSECLIAATHTNSNEGDVFIHGNDVNRRVQHAHTDGARKEGRGRRKTKNIYTHTHTHTV